MRLSIQLFGLPPDQYAPIVEHADALGFDAAWLADHVITPVEFAKTYPYKESGDPGYRGHTPLVDVGAALGFLAARTARIKLGTGVLILPLRNPFHVARTWATLQHLSGGRMLLGIGTGWMAEEFDAVGENFADRGARADEMLDVMALLWSGEPVSHEGRFYPFPPVQFGGAPEQPIPIIVGGHSTPAFRRAAQRGAGWYSPDVDLPTALGLIRQIDELRERAGRGDQPFTHYVRISGEVTVENVSAYGEAGLRDLVLAPFIRLPKDATLADRLGALDDVAHRLDGVV